MGIADSKLPELATLVPGMTVGAMAFAMWFYSQNKSGFAVASTFLMWYSVTIRESLNVNNPLSLYVGADLVQGKVIYNEVLLTLCLVFGLIGTFVGSVTGICSLIPIYACLPGTASIRNSYQRTTNGYPILPHTGLNAWNMNDLPRPYIGVAINLFSFILSVIIPYVVFEHYMDTHSTLAVCVLILVSIAGPAVGWGLNKVWVSAYIFGAHKNNIKELGHRYYGKGLDEEKYREVVHRDTTRANARINKTFLSIGAFTVLGNLILGVVRLANDDVDMNWPFAVGVGAFFIILTAIVGIVLHYRNTDPEEVYKEYEEIPASKEEEDILAEDTALVQGGDRTQGNMQSTFRRVMGTGNPMHEHV